MNPNIYKLLVAISLITASCSKNKSLYTNRNVRSDSLTLELNKFKETSLIPGFSVSIVDEKNVIYSKGFGLANIKNNIKFTPETIHGVASISKTFIALSIMKLVEEKKLNLDEPINSILPYKIINPYYPNVPITVRHLISHTSSIIDDAFIPYYIGEADICIINDDKSYDSLPAYLQPNLEYYRMGKKISFDENIRKYTQPKEKWYTDSTFLNKEPGKYFQYSNLGSCIAARIIEIKSNMSFIDFTKQYIFKPLNLKNTTWSFEDVAPTSMSKIYAHNQENKPTGVVEHPFYYMTNFPVSGLKTNTNDLSTYLIEMIKGFNGKGKLLSKESYQILFKPQLNCENLNKNDLSDFNTHFNISILWSVSATGYRIHFGGNTGIYAFIYFNPKTSKGALAMCNLRDDSFGNILNIIHKYENTSK